MARVVTLELIFSAGYTITTKTLSTHYIYLTTSTAMQIKAVRYFGF